MTANQAKLNVEGGNVLTASGIGSIGSGRMRNDKWFLGVGRSADLIEFPLQDGLVVLDPPIDGPLVEATSVKVNQDKGQDGEANVAFLGPVIIADSLENRELDPSGGDFALTAVKLMLAKMYEERHC